MPDILFFIVFGIPFFLTLVIRLILYTDFDFIIKTILFGCLSGGVSMLFYVIMCLLFLVFTAHGHIR